MFKKTLVSIGLGAFLLFSLSLWAQNKQAPVVVAKLQVENQLSISAHEIGEDRFISQVGDKKSFLILGKENLPMPLLSSLGALIFGLMYFVLRSSRQRVK